MVASKERQLKGLFKPLQRASDFRFSYSQGRLDSQPPGVGESEHTFIQRFMKKALLKGRVQVFSKVHAKQKPLTSNRLNHFGISTAQLPKGLEKQAALNF